MPSALTYPGVYVEEIPSGVRTITGVATSITAFIGATRRGPLGEPVTINSFGDFESQFGGLWLGSSLGFAVRDFFLNGGSQAIIVRLYAGDAAGDAAKGTFAVKIGDFQFAAASPGKWGVSLRAAVDLDNISDDVAKGMGLTKADLFNLTVRDTDTGATEKFLNLTLIDSPRKVDKVLASDSGLIRSKGDLPKDLKAINDSANSLAAATKALKDRGVVFVDRGPVQPSEKGALTQIYLGGVTFELVVSHLKP